MLRGPDPRPFAYIDLPLTFVCVAFFSPKKGHGFFIILRTVYDVDHFALGANGLSGTGS
jgi:hypothetical protein